MNDFTQAMKECRFRVVGISIWAIPDLFNWRDKRILQMPVIKDFPDDAVAIECVHSWHERAIFIRFVHPSFDQCKDGAPANVEFLETTLVEMTGAVVASPVPKKFGEITREFPDIGAVQAAGDAPVEGPKRGYEFL